MKESNRSKQAAIVIGGLLILYASSYLFIRLTSISFEDLLPGGAGTWGAVKTDSLIILGVNKGDLIPQFDLDPISREAEEKSLERRTNLIGNLFMPAIWIDQKLTGTRIISDFDELPGAIIE